MEAPELEGRGTWTWGHINMGAYGGPPCYHYRVLINTPGKSIMFWSNSFTLGQYSSFLLSINVVISLLVTASDITALPDPEKHPNG
jgi:hypothetical protein